MALPPDRPVARKVWNYYTYNRVTGLFTLDGAYPAPIQEVPIRDGRVAGMTVDRDVNGKKIIIRHAQRSELGTSRFKFWREQSGADGGYEIYPHLNEWVKTGAELKIETHIAGLVYMGAFKGSPRVMPRSSRTSVPEYEIEAEFEHYWVDGTGAGW